MSMMVCNQCGLMFGVVGTSLVKCACCTPPFITNQQATSDSSTQQIHALKNAILALGTDPHQFGTRPCQTCEQVSKAMGEAWGCVLKRKQESSYKWTKRFLDDWPKT